MFFADVLNILITYHQGFLAGLAVTLNMALIIWGVGVLVGTGLGVLAAKYRVEVGLPARGMSFFLGAVPTLVFLFWLHYPIQALFNVVIDPFLTATFCLSILNIFAVCDLVRNAVDEFPQQYLTAAKVCGLNARTTILHIQLPLMFRQVLPGLLILQIAMLHTTLFASLISVEEIFRVAQRINASIYKPVEIYTALGFFFIIVCLPVNILAVWLKNKYTRNISER